MAGATSDPTLVLNPSKSDRQPYGAMQCVLPAHCNRLFHQIWINPRPHNAEGPQRAFQLSYEQDLQVHSDFGCLFLAKYFELSLGFRVQGSGFRV